MSIHLTDDDAADRATLGERLERLGVHDWTAAPEARGALLELTAATATGLDDASLLGIVDALPRPALVCGHASYLKRVMHTVHNALTPALIGVSMTRDMLGERALEATALSADLSDVLVALEAAQSRMSAVTELADGRLADIAPGDVLRFLDRPDSVLGTVTSAALAFELSAAPRATLQPGRLESWLLTLAGALGADQDATLTVHLGARSSDLGAHAWVRIETTHAPGHGGIAPALFSVQRDALAQGAQVELTPQSVDLALPPVRPMPSANGLRALVAIAHPEIRARINGALLADGYLTSDVAHLRQAQAQLSRYGEPSALILDARASARWGADAPAHIAVADLALHPQRTLSKATQWISAFASPACIRQAAARQAQIKQPR